jgi:hypothetical protein
MGLDTVSYCLILEEIARADSSVRSILAVQCTLVGSTVDKWGNETQKREWLPRLTSGEALGCFCLTEPDAGSDAGSLRTSAHRDGEDWILDGSKMFITNGTVAKLAIVMAQTDPSKGSKGLAAFLVPTETPGFTATEIKGKIGLRSSSTAEVHLAGVRVPNANMLGEIGDGMKVALSALDSGRIGLAAGCVGMAQASLDASLAYTKEREQFGRPIAGFQLVQDMLAEMHVSIEAARLLTWKAAMAKDKGQRPTLEASVAKYFASEAAVKCSNLAIQVHGGYGYIREYQVERHFRDAKITQLYEGTSEIQRLVIAREVLGGTDDRT